MKYESLFLDANILYEAYLSSIKGSKWKATTQRFRLNFLLYLYEISDDIENRTLKNGKSRVFKKDERGKVRIITSIGIRDQVIRHVLCDYVLMPEVRKRIIYDNCASLKGRGISQQRKRFEIHLHKYYQLHGSNEGFILFGDFTKFYDNIIHAIAKRELLKLVNDDEFVEWLLDLIFDSFKVDASYLSDEEYENCLYDVFNSIDHYYIPDSEKTGEKWMKKSVNIGDQLSQIIGIYYPYRIDNYVKTVRGMKFYGRYMDDFYLMAETKEELWDILDGITAIAEEYGMHLNMKKTRIVKMGSTYKFLQIKYKLTETGKIIKRINPKRVTAMRQRLKSIQVKVINGDRVTDDAIQMFRSWMGGHYKYMSRKQRNNLLTLFEDLYDVTITIRKHKLYFQPNDLAA